MSTEPRYPMGRIHIPDARDQNFPLRAITQEVGQLPPKPIYHQLGVVQDQGQYKCPYLPGRHSYCGEKGFCTGATAWSALKAGPKVVKNPPDPVTIYHEGQLRDQWPTVGQPTATDPYPDASEYAGGSIRGVLKYLQELGHVESYHWADSALDIAKFIPQGTVMLGTNWYTGMFDPDPKTGVAKPTGRVAGGHAYILLGYKPSSGMFRCQSSWGRGWAQAGRFWLTGEDLDRLLREDGEASAVVEAR
jgi:hypothetical protein